MSLAAIVFSAMVVSTASGGELLATRPPLGWNSFDSYGTYLHERAAVANVDAMADRLKPFGYEYFVIDNGWFGEFRLREGTLIPLDKHARDVRINEYGHFLPSGIYFPNGLRPIADRCHDLGLKFGVHLMRGIPRKAYDLDLPIKGTNYTAREIANTDPKQNCKWCQYCYCVDMSKPGAQEWYDGLIQHVADMGVDFIKYDDIVPYPLEVKAVASAIKKLNKPVILSLSPGDRVDPNEIESFRKANMLRVTNDIWDDQRDIDACFAAWRKWQGKERPGFWVDMDMIPFGELQIMSPAEPGRSVMSNGTVALTGKGVHRWCQLSKAQKRTFITLRAMAASPLMVGGNLPSMDEHSLELLTEEEMLKCNQNGVMGKLLSECDGIEVWQTLARSRTDKGWIGIFNRTETTQRIELTRELLGIGLDRAVELHDVWNRRKRLLSTDSNKSIELDPNDVLFLAFRTVPNKSQPNIIYILADDLGYGDLSCYGQTRFRTPAIDRMAKEGKRFTNHYAGSTVCAPSRASLMTGLHCGHCLVRGNYEVGPHGFGGELPLRDSDQTIAEVAKQPGYRTGVFGKWGMGMDETTGEPSKQGFDYSYGFLNQAHAHHYYPEYIFRNGVREMIPENQYGKRGTYISDRIIEEGLEFIDRNHDAPFFIYWALTTPHAELLVPEASLQEFAGRWPETPFVQNGSGGNDSGDGFGVYSSQATPRAAFAAMVRRMDSDVARILAKLKQWNLDENTIVIFSSDNGPHREGGADPEFFNSSAGLRGGKRDLYEGGIRVPMIVRWPGTIAAGTESDYPCAFWDILPSIAELTGANPPSEIDGASLVPTLLGKPQPSDRYLYWEFHESGNLEQAVRYGKWKAVRHGPKQPLELYDLEADDSETNNVATSHPEIVRQIEAYLQTARTPSEVWQ